MKVFGIGYHRTGTTTLNECLKRLGFTHKGYDLQLLRAWSEGNLEPIREAADRHSCFEDWPWPLVFRELDEWYPDAKFVLTVRESPEKWLASVKRHARTTGPTESRNIIYGDPRPEGSEEVYLEQYRTHNRAVRAHFAERPDKLLEVCWETGSGWEDLGEFLDIDVPDEPLPHANKSTTWQRWTMAHKRWKRLAREALGMRRG